MWGGFFTHFWESLVQYEPCRSYFILHLSCTLPSILSVNFHLTRKPKSLKVWNHQHSQGEIHVKKLGFPEQVHYQWMRHRVQCKFVSFSLSDFTGGAANKNVKRPKHLFSSTCHLMLLWKTRSIHFQRQCCSTQWKRQQHANKNV